MTPTVGRTVHYVAYGTPGGEYPAGAHRAAIVTAIGRRYDNNTTNVSLCILNPTGFFFTQEVEEDQGEQGPPGLRRDPRPGTWHWPEREF